VLSLGLLRPALKSTMAVRDSRPLLAFTKDFSRAFPESVTRNEAKNDGTGNGMPADQPGFAGGLHPRGPFHRLP